MHEYATMQKNLKADKVQSTYQEKKEVLVVERPNTIDNPNTMMIHFQYTPPTWNKCADYLFTCQCDNPIEVSKRQFITKKTKTLCQQNFKQRTHKQNSDGNEEVYIGCTFDRTVFWDWQSPLVTGSNLNLGHCTLTTLMDPCRLSPHPLPASNLEEHCQDLLEQQRSSSIIASPTTKQN